MTSRRTLPRGCWVRMLPRGCWVVHTRDEGWSAMELGAAYHPIPRGLPGIFLGRLAKSPRRRSLKGGPSMQRLNPLVKVLWMGKIFLCALDDVTRIP